MPRATGEPVEVKPIACDAAESLPEVAFPTAAPRVMRAERTFWEKATAAHVYRLQERLRGNRFSRHWHDLARLDEAGIAASAVGDKVLARAVADHKSMFFAVKAPIEYRSAVSGAIRLVPVRAGRSRLEEDYEHMVVVGLLWGEAEPFGELMSRCQEPESMLNHR